MIIDILRFLKAAGLRDDEAVWNSVWDDDDEEYEDLHDYEWIVPVSYKTNVLDFPTEFILLNKSKSKCCKCILCNTLYK